MTCFRKISRRTVLRGLGTAVALPWLEAMSGRLAYGGDKQAVVPSRMAFVYVPNGMHMADWTPELAGSDFKLPFLMEPFEPVKEHLLVLSGLAQDHARPHGDGPGDHARSLASFLTGCQARKTSGADIQVGVSVDQLAAQKIGNKTKFASLELGCEVGPQSGNCDSGYSCAYSANVSWRSESTPVAKEINPRLLFERLFSDGVGEDDKRKQARRLQNRQSVLDFVLEDARQLRARLGMRDVRKVDEYLNSVRELEQRIVGAATAEPKPAPPMAQPDGIPSDFGEHLRLMYELLALAFQGDLTRVATFVVANEGSNRSYADIEVPEGHHELSHHGGNAEKQAKIRKINRFHTEHFAELLKQLKNTPEGEGSLLDNVMIVYGSGIGDGNRHNHDNLPIVLAGKGRGTIATGRHLQYKQETPLNNLYLAMLDRIDASTERFGDSSGKLELA